MAERVCPNCDYRLPAKASFCGRCGAPLPDQPRSRRQLVLVVIILTGLFLVGAFLFREELSRSFDSGDGEGYSNAAGTIPSTGEAAGRAEVPVATEDAQTIPDASGSVTATSFNATGSTTPTQPAATPVPSKTPSVTPLPTLTPAPTFTPSPTITPTLSSGPENLVVGYSVNNEPIEVVRFGTGSNTIIFVGGIHAGFAPGSVRLAQRAVEYFTENPETIPAAARVYVIVSMNPDSTYAPGQISGRLNANGVDLNRNWACEWGRNPEIDGRVVRGAGGNGPLSEPETSAVADFIVERDPVAVIFWEARAHDGLVSPGGCGSPGSESYNLTVAYARGAGYRWDDFESLIGQVVQGDASNWLDLQGIPAAVVLVRSFTEPDWERNRLGIEAVLRAYGND